MSAVAERVLFNYKDRLIPCKPCFLGGLFLQMRYKIKHHVTSHSSNRRYTTGSKKNLSLLKSPVIPCVFPVTPCTHSVCATVTPCQPLYTSSVCHCVLLSPPSPLNDPIIPCKSASLCICPCHPL